MLFDTRFLTRLSLAIGGLLAASAIGCSRANQSSEAPPPSEEPSQVESTADSPLRVAVGGMITPRDGFTYYRDLLHYIESEIGRPVQFADRKSYAEINTLLKSGKVDAGFVCSGPYIDGHEDFGLELLVMPQVDGKAEYYSTILVPAGSPAKRLEDLRGKRFAFADPKSNTGKLVPTYLLSKMNETPESFFARYIYTYAHDKSVWVVAEKLVDGAAVHSLIWDYLRQEDPQLESKVTEIWRSPPFGSPPVVVRPGLDSEIKGRLRAILLDAHNDDTARPILEGMAVEKFVVGNDSAYDSIREMERWVEQQREVQASKE
jgi:phosphonate transport system substrate-binding protein